MRLPPMRLPLGETADQETAARVAGGRPPSPQQPPHRLVLPRLPRRPHRQRNPRSHAQSARPCPPFRSQRRPQRTRPRQAPPRQQQARPHQQQKRSPASRPSPPPCPRSTKPQKKPRPRRPNRPRRRPPRRPPRRRAARPARASPPGKTSYWAPAATAETPSGRSLRSARARRPCAQRGVQTRARPWAPRSAGAAASPRDHTSPPPLRGSARSSRAGVRAQAGPAVRGEYVQLPVPQREQPTLGERHRRLGAQEAHRLRSSHARMIPQP